ncbi:ABC transporter ATP-binding protein [uncultured Jannaschia sp.]|uniref:ABC transporter ATP-binding protein n=1 Tax=uncultured Jannaschia sp. TaxID=293347 RepID=UPI00262B4F2B|nr:ABC transporter ATP-binding protein [uncultured Jannaschia sp.]
MKRTYARILALLDAKQRRNVGLLVVMMLVMGLMDLAGVASILPFLAVLGNPGIIEDRAALAWIYDGLGFTSNYAFLQFLGIAVFVVVMSSIALRALTFYFVTRFARGVATSLGIRLLRQYLARPFEWFLSQHSADLGKSVLAEVNQVVTGSIGPAIRIIANAIVLSFLVGFLLVLEPVGALVMGVLLGVCFGLIYRRLRGHLLEIGQDRKIATRERYKITTEAMGGIKEVKTLGLEDIFVKRFHDPSWRLARHQASVSLLGEMPRYVLEALAFGGMLVFILYLLWSHDGSLDTVLPVLGAFAFAGLKLMPTIQILFRDLAQIRFGEAALEALHDDLAVPLPPTPKRRLNGERPIRLQRELRMDRVSYTYPGAARPALDGLSLVIPAGTSAGFVGPTGAGKTTAIDVILGLLLPASGQLSVDGIPITSENLHHWQAEIGYVPQTIFLSDDTVAANIAFGEAEIDHEAVRRAACLAHLDEFVQTLPQGYDTVVGEHGVRFSGGQRQRIGIARALYRNPDIVVFDEATSALDNVTERAVMEAIRTLHGQKTVIMIAHRLTTVAQCNTIFFLRDGRLDGTGDYDALAQENGAFRSLVAAAQ